MVDCAPVLPAFKSHRARVDPEGTFTILNNCHSNQPSNVAVGEFDAAVATTHKCQELRNAGLLSIDWPNLIRLPSGSIT